MKKPGVDKVKDELLRHKVNPPVLVAFILFFISIIFMAMQTSYTTVCASTEPDSCAYPTEEFAETALEKRDDKFIAKAKDTMKVEDLKFPEEAVTLAACDATYSTQGMPRGPYKLATPDFGANLMTRLNLCHMLGCKVSDCLKTTTRCEGKGVAKSEEPTVECVARNYITTLNPFLFTNTLFGILFSLGLLCYGCCLYPMKAPEKSTEELQLQVQAIKATLSSKNLDEPSEKNPESNVKKAVEME